MNTTNRNYESSQEKLPVSEAHPWLQKHYQEKRERTIHLVKATVDQLVKEKQTVTIEAICHKSAQIDEEGRGVKKSAVLENQEAHAYYRAHSASYRAAAARKRTSKAAKTSVQPHPFPIQLHPNVNQPKLRYFQIPKPH